MKGISATLAASGIVIRFGQVEQLHLRCEDADITTAWMAQVTSSVVTMTSTRNDAQTICGASGQPYITVWTKQ